MSSKQLIVYFVFLVIALSAAFLAGVMVGRNVDSSPEPTVREFQDDRPPDEPAAQPTPDALTYGSTLQGDKLEGLSSSPRPGAAPAPSAPKPAPAATAPAPASKAKPPQTRGSVAPPPKPTAKPQPNATPKPASSARAAKPVSTPLSRLTIQVGAFKERAAAEAIVKRLKGKGYSAYLVPVSEGLFNVRVGSFTEREDAERILAKLESQEKFKPFIVKP